MSLHKTGFVKPRQRQTAYIKTFLVMAALVTAVPSAPPVRLALMGDIMLGRGIAEVHDANSWGDIFAEIHPLIAGTDVLIANLESPLGSSPIAGLSGQTDPKEGYNLCAPPESIRALTSARFDLLTLANNHTGDCSKDGAALTGNRLLASGIQPVIQAEPVYRTVHGVHLAFFAFDDVSAPWDDQSAAQQVRQASEDGWLPVVSIHWGSEYHPGPDARQRALAQEIADTGAVLVWGHHPHVLQQAEWLAGYNKPHPTLVLFSLGNALFDQPSPPDSGRSAVVVVTLSSNGVETFETIPIQIDFLKGRVILAVGDDHEKIHQRLGQK